MSKKINKQEIDKIEQHQLMFNIWEQNILFYKNRLEKFGQHRYSNVNNFSELLNGGKIKLKKIIYNHDVFFAKERSLYEPRFDKHEKAQINFKDIGFNIHWPPQTNGILVQVYGGYRSSELKERFERPAQIINLFDKLLSKNILIITLNTLDLLRFDVYQSEISESDHQDWHNALNEFLQCLKNEPEKLHPELKVIKGKPIILYGASYGGRTAIKHLELYPDNADGSICFDSSISYTKRNIEIDFRHYLPHLRINHDKVTKPVYVIQNRNDLLVHTQVALDGFYSLDQKVSTSIFFNSKGGNIRSTSKSLSFKDHELNNHFLPIDNGAMAEYILNIFRTNFSTVKALHQLRAFDVQKHETKMYIDYKNFIAEGMKAKLLYNFADKAYSIYLENTDSLSKDEQKQWLYENKNFYQKFYFALKYSAISKTKENKLLNENLIKDAIKTSFTEFFKVAKEDYGFDIPDNISFDDLLNQYQFINEFSMLIDRVPMYHSIKLIIDLALASSKSNYHYDIQENQKRIWGKEFEEEWDKLNGYIAKKNSLVKDIWHEIYDKIKHTQEYKDNLQQIQSDKHHTHEHNETTNTQTENIGEVIEYG